MGKKSKVIELPKVPSELLEIGLEDMKATLEQGFQIDMGSWGSGNLETDDKEWCSVCFAGAVMLQRTHKHKKDLDDFTPSGVNENCYQFLDSIRSGELREAVDQLGLVEEIESGNKYMETVLVEEIDDWLTYDDVFYDEDLGVEVFFKQLEDLIVFFKSIGH